MTNNWFHRLILSYLPVFISMAALLLLLVYFIGSDLSRKSAIRANEVFTGHAAQTLDNQLQTVEQAVLRKIFSENTIEQYLKVEIKPLDPVPYEVSVSLAELKDSFPLIDSIYVVRDLDSSYVSNTTIGKSGELSDSAFVEAIRKDKNPYLWTGVREFQSFAGNRKVAVISLVKAVPFFSGGYVVVNVDVEAVQNFLKNMSSSSFNYMRVLDRDKQVITATEPGVGEGSFKETLTKKVSSYTGWEIQSGVKYLGLLHSISNFTLICIGIAAMTFVAGIIWIVYVSRRNYRPVLQILAKINSISSMPWRNGPQQGDEFAQIESAIEQMAEDTTKFTTKYEQMQEESMAIRRQAGLKELLEGIRPVDAEEWKRRLEALQMPLTFKPTAVIVVEIDAFTGFRFGYSTQDQALFKYALRMIVAEIADHHRAVQWIEWIAPNRLGMMLEVKKKAEEGLSQLYSLCEEARLWTVQHLPFTITMGIGKATGEITDIPQSYESALRALACKASLGTNRVIESNEAQSDFQQNVFRHIQAIQPLAIAYKRGDESWKAAVADFFVELRKVLLTREDLIGVMNYMIYYFHKEMKSLSGSLDDKWELESMPQLTAMLEWIETLDETEICLLRILNEYATHAVEQREQSNHYALLGQIRGYIEEHYANPELSLIYIGDKFDMNPNYLSRLFKSEHGENFVDYLIDLRMDHAKRLLSETSKSVQEIATSVGYTTSIAFIRMFKKTYGYTPGDFRKKASFR
ncbi:helix-turn-helix domain-containing protein [Paenibacillus eucommiae]|uniref:AraC-like DNA-binding protein n=1 Tax=Paenibacillus eucommiae TaxID=1355755 RepID=A0ABS4IMW9_9BACL|nr:helix-turn-helix domain-containing protein [Paenibacillus eucommiae]MBP1988510.1 AraC-like DNA-binding protein [Paenibacillus eucommiae]